MARKSSKTKNTKRSAGKKASKRDRVKPFRWLRRLIFRGGLLLVAMIALIIVTYAFVNPPTTPYMFSEGRRLDGIKQEWVAIEDIAPVMARAAVAAEDANYCLHWGLDVTAIRRALDNGYGGASTISQQMVKNVYLWQGRSWFRKALEATLTPVVELVWSKQRILEVYLNIAEFDEGVFGVQAAAQHYFGVEAADLTRVQASRLAAILPAPRSRSASDPSLQVRRRASGIMDGAETIRQDGRADCFQ